ncbi:MAG: type II toxin-antitoxin system RelE/ParE family toxin [Actinobacteria bacterium]|nr:type II toxin-antitoxin system RelE/ParE family toxin [Actinomycetota bacterium]
MTYEVEVTYKAAQAIRKLPAADRDRVNAAIKGLAADPRPRGAEKLAGMKNAYRVRSGNYRVVYTVDDSIRVVSVARVAHRREVYRRL